MCKRPQGTLLVSLDSVLWPIFPRKAETQTGEPGDGGYGFQGRRGGGGGADSTRLDVKQGAGKTEGRGGHA